MDLFNATTPALAMKENTTIFVSLYTRFFSLAELMLITNFFEVLCFLVIILGLPSIPMLLAVTLTPAYRKLSYSLYLTFMCFYDLFIVISLALKKFEWSSYSIDLQIPCQIYHHLYRTAFNCSLWLNVALAADRFIVILFPFHKERLCTRKASWIVCGVIVTANHALNVVSFIDVFHVIVDSDLTVYWCDDRDFSLMWNNSKKENEQDIIRKIREVHQSHDILGNHCLSTIAAQLPHIMVEISFMLFNVVHDGRAYFDAMYHMTDVRHWIYIQNFYILFLMNGQFRNDVFKLFGFPQCKKFWIKSREKRTSYFD